MIERGEKIGLKLPGDKGFTECRVETGLNEAPGVIVAVRRLTDGQRFLWLRGRRLQAVPG